MYTTSIIRRVDDLGRVVIPKEIRRAMGIVEGTPLEIFIDKQNQMLGLSPCKPNEIYTEIRGVAERLDTAGNTPEEWEVAIELRNIAKKLEKIHSEVYFKG